MTNVNNQVQPANSSALKQTYTVSEISGILGVPLRTAYDFCNRTDQFKVLRLGKAIRINKKSFDAWFDA